MSAFKNIGMRDYFKRYGWKYGFLRGLYMSLPLHKVSDYENKKILYYRKIYGYLNTYYEKFATVDPEGLEYGLPLVDNPVWVYWKQGKENMPDIVKACIKSHQKYVGKRMIFLTDSNLADYIKLPDTILAMVKNGNISAAAYSDLIRYSLLEHYGGTWIDATTLLTAQLPDYITCSDFFAFRDSFGLIENPALTANWLIHSAKHNDIIREIRNTMFGYWTKERHVIEYLLCYIIMTIVLKKHDALESMPYANSDYSHLLFNILDCKYDEKRFNHIKELSSVHKLSYKLTAVTINSENTFYDMIVNKLFF